ncbi:MULTISPECIES: hypothetical protein [Alphaproteobacteria]|uniref:hypothetical protein n=1 Tax=Alphaproteobacteria TaxID=28211 RepID=UPI003263B4D1
MSKRLFLLAVAASLAGTPAMAKTVRTDTIRVAPIETPASGTIPVEDSITSQQEPGADDKVLTEELELPLPEVLYDTSLLPKPVARMHSQLFDAAISGDIERLRMVLESNEVPPTLSLIEIDDPIEFLKESSGDPDGLEILAILADTLDAGFLHADVGTAQEMYIWPYFARYPFHALTADQKVEMYRIVTAADFAEMEAFGVWLFYRVGIGKDGTLHYFVAGE